MGMCFVTDCKHYSVKHACKFFRFPKTKAERNRWISLIRRKDRDPSQFAKVCDCHFVNKEKKNGPTLFDFNVQKKFNNKTPEKRKRTAKEIDDQENNLLLFTEPQPGPSNQPCSQDQEVTQIKIVAPLLSPSSASQDAENYFLKQQVAELTEKLEKLTLRFSYEMLKTNDAHLLMYTGIPTNELFMIIFELMDDVKLKYYAGWNVQCIPKVDQLLITLMKLRLNLPHEVLGIRFSCSPATVTNTVMTWIYALHEVLFKTLMKTIPSRQRNQACLPIAFTNFKSCRIILDCTEIYSAVPSSMENQRLTYSSYKHRNTWKILVGVAPNGVITFVSKAYPGSTSDKKVVDQSKVLDQMVPGDLILADKGFLIKDLLPAGVSLNIPPFLTTPQFTESQVYETQQIAKARIHVERAIRRIKCYNILQQVPSHYISQISIIFQVCAALTNFQYPPIKEDEEYY